MRDGLLGIDIKDYDVEVFNIPLIDLLKVLEKQGRVDTVGRAFGVIKWTPCKGETYDIAVPRKELKSGKGHRGFDVEPDPYLPHELAASRRDYTINSIMYDPLKHEMLDPFGGKNDLDRKVLRHTSEAFAEDPLRVLRGMQFAGRFGMTGDQETLRLCQKISEQFHELPMERVWAEWNKWAAQSRFPSH